METLTVRRVIAAPITDVFDWCATSTNYTRSPYILKARLARPGAGAPYGVGAVRLHTWTIGYFRERITAYDAPHGFDYTVERSVPASRHEFGRMTFTEVDGGTEVVWTTRFEVRAPFGAALTRLAKPLIAHAFANILATADRALTARPATAGRGRAR
ncbi:SRPBCC family protein [Streptomyces sp. NBC_01431]|uniref:SRPBCC family protein n=1 Tax=Streptomyces sp. NBC_01431 TaxID=2903863 RepID=UPI002E327FF2|nr:SRPBCC family protein [Streptomyces sp. NBC_01431]